jgi:Zn finger protein HypA/HybF involved in hydrogenase expression
MKKISPRRVRIKCENCGEFNTTQRWEPMGCPQCGMPVTMLQILPTKV